MKLNLKKPAILLSIFSLLLLNFQIALALPAKANVRDIGRINFIHYAKGTGQSSNAKAGACYSLMGVKWKTSSVNYAINPTNSQGLSTSFITDAISSSAETWDNATSRELFNNSYSMDTTAVYGVLDDKNSITFSAYPDNNVIAVTSVWYLRAGREIVEFDQTYNTHFSWGDATADPTKMDLANIVTHELGHAVGLNDIYKSTCGEVTMYGYGTEGEIKKTSLEIPDIIGLQKMYGI
ncbi:MAG: hypothetical protein COY80_05285 [Candidatus Pacebacteria bacterium CG_4_10_14_0_8_um_filter_42_14]|nr:MAG: hypothetical protein COY80_05285 [Candidatus Pacebacteria bacterium CG_4_10_14_0_8_um_filter_42_14]